MKDKNSRPMDDMTADDRRIAELLGGLNRVNAPSDFEFRVRAGIASQASIRSGGLRLRRVILYAAPIVLLLAIGLPIAFYYEGRSEQSTVIKTGIDRKETATVTVSETPAGGPTAAEPAVEQRTSANRSKERDSVNTSADTTAPKRNEKTGGGSYVAASREGRRILPRGLDPNVRTAATPEDFSMNASIPVRDVLSTLGINAEFNGKAWTVESVTDNSTAARAGLRRGDLVLAIDDQPISKATDFKGKVSGKSIRILRAGRPASIELPKP